MQAIFINKEPSSLNYFSACDACAAHLPRHKFSYAYEHCGDDLKKYPLKELLGTKGWVDGKVWRTFMIHRDHPIVDFTMNAQDLHSRLVLQESVSTQPAHGT